MKAARVCGCAAAYCGLRCLSWGTSRWLMRTAKQHALELMVREIESSVCLVVFFRL